jgi:hypothetical protein
MAIFSQRARTLSSPAGLPYQLGLACLLGALVGAAVLWLPPTLAVALVIAPILVVAFVKRPELGILGILIVTSTLIGERQTPRIPGLYVTDILLLALFGLAAVRWFVERDFQLVRSPLSFPLLAFFSLTLLSTLIALYQGTVLRESAVTELRYVTYYLIFFAVINLVRTESQLRLLLRGLLLLAAVVAVVTLVQYTFGQSVQLLSGRVETLRTEGAVYTEVTRITNFSGEAILLLAFITGAVKLAMTRFSPGQFFHLLVWGIFGVGVILTFNRNFWFASAVCFLLLGLLIHRQDRQRYLAGGLLVGLTLLSVAALAYSQPDSRIATLADATVERMGSMVDSETFEENQTSTLRWRDFEYQYALPQIPENLFIGLGLGANYRPTIPGIDHERFSGQGYIHNAHLWLILKGGVSAYLCFLWFSALCLWRGFKYGRLLTLPWQRATVLGFSLTYLAVLIGSIVNPMLMQWYWIPLIGLMPAANELILQGVLARSDHPRKEAVPRTKPAVAGRVNGHSRSSRGVILA